MPIELSPEIEAELVAAANAAGMDPAAFLREAVHDKIRRNAFALSSALSERTEGELLEGINEGFPETFWVRYRDLISHRESETLTVEEQRELISLSDRVEQRTAERLDLLAELSRRRNISVRQLIAELGIHPVPVA